MKYFESKLGILYRGDALEELKKLPDKSVNMCVTSPPYWGLRDYAVEGQSGFEKTPEEYINKLVGVFREVRRVLKNDGTLWLNIGDSYNGSGKGGGGEKQETNKAACIKRRTNVKTCKVFDFGRQGKTSTVSKVNRGRIYGVSNLKPKDLIGIPWMLAFALRADGWYLRQDIIWAKKNCMPEAVKDCCTKSHEYIFVLSKSKKYYYDYKAIQEPAKHAGEYRNKRSVWTVSIYPYKGAHFACVDSTVECLTKFGWKKYDAIEKNDIAAQYNIKTQKISWGKIEDIFSYEVKNQWMIEAVRRDLHLFWKFYTVRGSLISLKEGS